MNLSKVWLPNWITQIRQSCYPSYIQVCCNIYSSISFHSSRMNGAGGTPNGVSHDTGGDNHSGSLVVTHNPTDEESSGPPKIELLGLKAVIAIVFFVIFLVSSVLGKLTLLSLTKALRNFTMPFSNEIVTRNLTVKEKEEMMYNSRSNPVSIYWQLLIILILPNFITFLRCLFFGFLGKSDCHHQHHDLHQWEYHLQQLSMHIAKCNYNQ